MLLRRKMPDTENQIEAEPMHHPEITLADGRYMIFYTFGGEEPNTVEETDDQTEDV